MYVLRDVFFKKLGRSWTEGKCFIILTFMGLCRCIHIFFSYRIVHPNTKILSSFVLVSNLLVISKQTKKKIETQS